MTTVLDVFPHRRLKLSSYGTSLRPQLSQILIVLIFGAVLVFDIFNYTPGLIDEIRLQGATPAVRSSVGEGGECSTTNGLTTCDFKAEYETIDGRTLEKRVHYSTLFQKVDDNQSFVVNYDPRSPSHISTSWGRRMLVNRLITQVISFAFAGLLIWLLVVEYAWRFRVRKSLEAIAAEPMPLIARFVRVASARRHADVHFKWTYPATGIEHDDRTRFARGVQPFWLDSAKTLMLALAGPDGHAHLLDANLRQVALTDAERGDLLRFRAQIPKP